MRGREREREGERWREGGRERKRQRKIWKERGRDGKGMQQR